MGLLRLLLALSVVLTHTRAGLPFPLFGGEGAVQTFFMISGFYMGLVLTERYTGPGSYRLFLSNRMLRVFPAYWAVLVAAAVCFAFGITAGRLGPLGFLHAKMSPPVVAGLILTQVVIVGQEGTLFVRRTPAGEVAFSHTLAANGADVWRFNLVPQAWSLSLELVFYVFAPFLVLLSNSGLAFVAAASFACRIFIYFPLRWANDPWIYRFFPNELLFFVAGLGAYRVYKRLRDRQPSFPTLTVVTVATLGLIVFFPHLPGNRYVGHAFQVKQWALYAAIWGAIPYLFLWSNPPQGRLVRVRRADRWIGELSYPLYVVHILVIQLYEHFTGASGSSPREAVVVTAASIVLSMAILHLIMEPVQRLRERRVSRNRSTVIRSETLDEAADVVNP